MEVKPMSVVTKFGVKVCLKQKFGENHGRASDYLRRKAGPAAIITLIDGEVHMATNPSSFEIWFDTMKELSDFLPAVGEALHA
jgi:hypothetical protein